MTAMLIRCKQKRTLPGGTKGSNIDMGDGTTIPFREDENGDHVAMVSNPKHLQRLLSITEGYEIHMTPDPVAPTIAAPPAPAPFTPETVLAAKTGPTHVSDPAPVTPPADASDLTALDDDQIRAVYEAELKRKPHHNSKRETMIAQIEALRAEASK